MTLILCKNTSTGTGSWTGENGNLLTHLVSSSVPAGISFVPVNEKSTGIRGVAAVVVALAAMAAPPGYSLDCAGCAKAHCHGVSPIVSPVPFGPRSSI